MKSWFAGLVCVSSIGVSAAVMAAPAPPETCKLSSAKGAYGFSESGSIVGFGPYAAVGTIVSDGAGNMKGIFSESAGGAIGSGITFVGTYAVNPDCTGTAELTDSLGRTGTRAFVIVQQGKEIQYVFTDPGFVATGVAKKQ